jgi:ferredoxin-NADP reductase
MVIRGLSNGTAMTISPIQWIEATVVDSITETPEVKSLILSSPDLLPHRAGQHYELRLTGEDGYQAARLYSGAPETDSKDTLRLTIQEVPDGEVTPYIHQTLAVGDKVEIRGPFGRFFVWRETDEQPVLLIGGGSGVIPLVSILEAHKRSGSATPMHLIYSSHTFDDIIYKDILLDNPSVTITLTTSAPKDWTGETGRISVPLLQNIIAGYPSSPIVYVCGMSRFVSAVNDALQTIGIPLSSIKTERFN